MKNICPKFILALLVMCFGVSNVTLAQSRKAQSWYDSKEWLQGGKFSPSVAIDVEEFAAHYKAHPNRWNKVFEILAREDVATLPLGSKNIDENIKMNVQEYMTRFAAGKTLMYEKHCKYIDVQCVISGEELHGTRKLGLGEVVKPYVEERDVALYHCSNVPFYIIHSGEFSIFFPDDMHTSNYGFGERTKVRKIVFKVKYE